MRLATRWAAVPALAVLLLTGLLVAPAQAATVRLGGVTVRLAADTTQVVTVNRSRGHHARVSLWVLTDKPAGRWVRKATTADGRIGYGGLSREGERRQGDGTTPLGTYDLPSAFGTHRRKATWDVPYHRIRKGDYWVGDNASPHYNRMRHRSRGGFRWWLPTSHRDASERLLDYRRQYEYALVTGFNAEQVRGRGFAIFLHVNGRGATAGCVSVPRGFMRLLLNRLDPDRHPVIAIGR